MRFELYSEGKKHDIDVIVSGEDLDVSFEGKKFRVRLAGAHSDNRIEAVVDGRQMSVVLDEETESTLRITLGGRQVTLGRAQTHLQDGSARPAGQTQAAAEQNALISPLFGKVISVDVKAGDAVDAGQSLVVVEAMKMESVMRADGKHIIKEVLVKEGDGVTKGQVMMRFG